MATTIQLRRDSATNWETENPILSAGEIGVDLTNNKFKLGDGSTAWNSLPYQGANADLTNYYTKSETNALLNEKENSLTPISPIVIEDVVDNPITGMEFSQDETELYQDINNSIAGIHIEQFGNDNAIYYTVGTDVLTSSYIEMPFEIGQRVTTGISGGSIGGSPIFGKYVGNDFIPILLCSSSNSAYVNNGFFLTSTDVPIQNNNFTGQVVGSSGYSGSEGRAFAQITDDSTYYIVLTECICSNRFTGMEFEYYCTQGTTEASRLEEITHCRIYPVVDAYGYAWAGSSSSAPFTYEYIGLYDATDTTYTNNLFDATSTVTREIRLNTDELPNKGYEVGDTIWRLLPSSDSGKHLLDGALIQGSGIYSDFVTYIADLVTNYPNLFETEANWQSAISTYGVCGKFVYTPTYYAWKGYFPDGGSTEITVYTDTLTPPTNGSYHVYVLDGSTLTEGNYVVYEQGTIVDTGKYIKIRYNGSDSGYMYRSTADDIAPTVRLPKITGIVEGTIDANALGDLVEAGLPNITGADMYATQWGGSSTGTGAFSKSTSNYQGVLSGTGTASYYNEFIFDASDSNSIYQNNFNKVQPQTIKGYLYIVIANTVKTDIEVDIDEIATDLNGKADVDLSNINASQSAKNTIVNWGLPDYDNGISLSSSSFPYTAPSDGYVYVEWYTSNYAGVALYSDNHIVDYQRNAYNGALNMAVKGFVSKSSILTLDGNSGAFERAIFYPLKGVN